MVGSSVIADDRTSFLTFGHQNHTCSQCMKHYCYRAEDQFRDRDRRMGKFLLECCDMCEKELCVECSGMYQCERCSKYYCMGCTESTACHNHNESCENRVCSDYDLSQCVKCKKGFCFSWCSTLCNRCDCHVCHGCDDDFIQYCSNDDCVIENKMCIDCASENTCRKCKRAFCGCDSSAHCLTCNQTFCRDCVILSADVMGLCLGVLIVAVNITALIAQTNHLLNSHAHAPNPTRSLAQFAGR